MTKYTPNTQQLRTLREYQHAHNQLTSGFVNKKLALAAQALVDQGMTKKQVAKALDLPNAHDVWNLLALAKGVSNA